MHVGFRFPGPQVSASTVAVVVDTISQGLLLGGIHSQAMRYSDALVMASSPKQRRGLYLHLSEDRSV